MLGAHETLFLHLLLNRFSIVCLAAVIFSNLSFRREVSPLRIESHHTKSDDLGNPRVYTIELHQDDPAKCTSAKMRKLGLASKITPQRISRYAIVLNPFAQVTLRGSDRDTALTGGLVVIDCSWVTASHTFERRYRGNQRRLPALMAGNPTNYSKLGNLSSLEAAAGALYIMNFFDLARKLLNAYKWGDTFLSLNQEVLDEYSSAKDEDDIAHIEESYFPTRTRM